MLCLLSEPHWKVRQQISTAVADEEFKEVGKHSAPV